MGVVWHKVWRDLVNNKARTALVVLSTAVGVFALGLVFGLYGVLRARIMGSYQASIPAHVVLRGGPFDREAVAAVGREDGVAAVEGGTGDSFRWKLPGEDQWRKGDLVARDDFDMQRINRLRLRDGRWPDEQVSGSVGRALAIECLSSEFFDLPVGSAILVEFGERERSVAVEGVACAPVVLPPTWGGDAMVFATPETAAWLSGSGREDFDRLNVILTAYSEQGAAEMAERIEDRLERMGLRVGGYEVNDPDEFWIQSFVDGAMAVLAVMGVLSLGLSGFLIVNTMNAILVQQVWQIGVMKAVGGTLGQVMHVYLTMALVYGGLALLLAVPLGIIGAQGMAVWLLGMFNVELGGFQFQPVAVGLQLVVGVTVPLAAAAIPVIGGAGITVREAIGSHGLGSDFGTGWLDQLIGRVRRLPRPLALSLRNSFRRKARAALTLATLVFSGAMFVVVQSTAESLDNTVLKNFSLGEEVSVKLDRLRRVSRAIEIAGDVDGVEVAEVWNRQDGTLLMPACPQRGRREDSQHPVDLTGIPPDSAIFDPNIVHGRSLRPGDGRVLVFTSRLAEKEGFRVGDTVTLDIEGENSEWTIVGLYLSIDNVSDEFFAPLDVVGRETGTAGRGRYVRTLVEGDDIPSQQRVIRGLKDAFAVKHIEVVDSWSVSEELVESRASFSILTSVLMVMVILAATVGSIGLMGTMSMNVVERTREIGVMRAIGASSLVIAGMFVMEGMLVGALSWLLAMPLSYPGARLFSDLIGEILLEMPLDFCYSTGGAVGWLVLVSVLSALASLLPALRATKISVREALAYE